MTPLAILAQLVPCLETAEFRYWVGGSVASSIWSEPRFTNDIDIAVINTSINEAKLRSALPAKFYVSPNEIAEALTDRSEYPSFQILDTEEAFKFDMFVVRATEYTLAQAERARLVEFRPGTKAPISSPEDIVLQKIRWFVSGGRVSDRQWNDLVKVVENQLSTLDKQYLAKWADHFEIRDLLTEAFDQAYS